MKKNNIILITIAIITLLALVTFAAYAYFANTASITNMTNLNVVSETNNMVFDTIGGGMLLNVTASNMSEANNNTVAAENNTTLTVSFQANTSYDMVCSYDIVYEWTSNDKYQAHTSGVTQNEFTIQASLASNAHVSQGTNNIKNETDLTTAVGNQTSATVVQGAQIDGTGSTTSTAVWTLTSKFYNVNANQSGLADKTYEGRFKVTNVSCVAGTVTMPGPTSYFLVFATRNENTGVYEPIYTFPEYNGPFYSDGSSITSTNVYLGQDNAKYYTCATHNGKEICLSQPFTQYGLSGHASGYFTDEEKENAMQALYQVFIDAGININISNCNSSTTLISCTSGSISCFINNSGSVNCEHSNVGVLCFVNKYGGAACITIGYD